MTATLPPRLRTLAEIRKDRLSRYWAETVSPEAHAKAHGVTPIHGCPGCPPAEGEAPDRGSEQYVREGAERPVSWTAGAAA